MIQATELRIGNCISYGIFQDGTSLNHEVVEIYSNRVVGKTSEGLRMIADVQLKPIPLTPEILEKAGFAQRDSNGRGLYWIVYIKNGEIAFWPKAALVSINISVDRFDDEYPQYTEQDLHHIKSLHQLQNLYFALTGTELNIAL